MIIRTALPFFAAGLLLIGCSQGTPAPDALAAIAPEVARTVIEVPISSGAPVTLADISITGMSCEMMCGGSIKKALAQLPGIAGTEIKFVEGDEQDHAIVTYDESKVTDAQMVEAIQKLHDGQYKVMAVSITKQVRGNDSSTGDGAVKEEEKGVSASIPPTSAILPSVVALLTRILTR